MIRGTTNITKSKVWELLGYKLSTKINKDTFSLAFQTYRRPTPRHGRRLAPTTVTGPARLTNSADVM